MAEKYNASKRIKTVAYKLGEAVTVKVPVQDRGPCDLNRIPGIIVQEKMAFTKSKHNMVFWKISAEPMNCKDVDH